MLLLLLLLLLPLLSHQVDAHLSYDAKACYDKAMHLMDMYAARGECFNTTCLRPSQLAWTVNNGTLQLRDCCFQAVSSGSLLHTG
jgi:hypothetical protein